MSAMVNVAKIINMITDYSKLDRVIYIGSDVILVRVLHNGENKYIEFIWDEFDNISAFELDNTGSRTVSKEFKKLLEIHCDDNN